MDITRLGVQLVVALVCGGIGNILVPRRIPGGPFGLIIIGLIGVWIGDLGYEALSNRYALNIPFLTWNIQGVLIIPSVIGSAIVLYISTLLLKMTRYR